MKSLVVHEGINSVQHDVTDFSFIKVIPTIVKELKTKGYLTTDTVLNTDSNAFNSFCGWVKEKYSVPVKLTYQQERKTKAVGYLLKPFTRINLGEFIFTLGLDTALELEGLLYQTDLLLRFDIDEKVDKSGVKSYMLTLTRLD